MRIVSVTSDTLPAAKTLVDRVFRAQGPFERLFFWMYRHRGSATARMAMRLRGISEFTALWVALSDDGAVIGTTGLYRYRKDAHEAVWLSWFCVAPESRHSGVGGCLLDFTIEQARVTGAAFLRLYTSDIPNEAAAQRLYESRGLMVYESRNRVFYQLFRRQMQLA